MNKFYYELTVAPKNSLELFSTFLLEITGNAIEEKSGSLIIRSIEPLDDIKWAAEQLAIKLQIPIKFNLLKLKNEDWISKYKNSIQPIEIGSFYVRPQWDEAKEQLTNIIINPALAFGSGHHETTHSCLYCIDKYVKPNLTLLDVGCGSGILAIAANKKGAIVDICDTDEISIKSSIENFKLNNSKIDKFWIGSANKSQTKYDIVIANIIADVIIMINRDLKQRVKNGGILILSGIISKYFDSIIKKFNDFEVIETIQKQEWHTIVLKKSIKEQNVSK